MSLGIINALHVHKSWFLFVDCIFDVDPCAVLARPQLICRDRLWLGQLEIVGFWNRSRFRFRIRVRPRFWFRLRLRFRLRFRFPFSLRFRFRFWLALAAERLDQTLLLSNFARRDRGGPIWRC